MHMLSLDKILSHIVERKGFAVQGVDQEALIARKGDEVLLVGWKTDGAITASDAQVFTTALDSLNGTRGILVGPRGADQTVRDMCAANKRLELWAESRLIVEAGEAFVKAALEMPTSAPSAPAPAAPAYSSPVSGGAATASRPPQNKFPSLIAQAVSATPGNNSGAAYYMPSKPKLPQPGPAATGEPGTLRYAWGGINAANVDPGVAQVRNGRKPVRAAEAPAYSDSATSNTPRRSSVIDADAESNDVELMTTPRKQAPAAEAAPAAIAPMPSPVAPAPVAAPRPNRIETEEYEIISKPRPAAAPAAPVEAAPAPAAPAPDAPMTTVRAQVDLAEATMRAQTKVGAVNFSKLVLVPHVAFEYDARIERPGLPAPMEGKGFVLASCLTGELRSIDRVDKVADPVDARRESAKFQAVDVYDKVKSLVAKQFTKELKVERELGGVTVMENQRIAPGVDEMGLEHRGTLHVPVWEITGASGTCRVDGLTGNIQ